MEILISLLLLSVVANIYFLRKSKKVKKLEKTCIDNINEYDFKSKAIEEKIKSVNRIIEDEKYKYDNKLEVEREKFEQKLNEVKSLIKSKHKKGYYIQKLTSTDDDGIKHNFDNMVYIREVDRYINGKSKIVFEKVEIVNKPSHTRYNHVLSYIKENFNSVIDTNNIEWLESVNEIQKEREDKLKRVLNWEKKNGIRK